MSTRKELRRPNRTAARAAVRRRARAPEAAARPGRPGGKRDTNRKRRTSELEEAALSLFLARGIETVTIDEIVERASMAKGSFYRYFPDKSALVESIFAPLAQQVGEAFTSCERALAAAKSRDDLMSAYQLLGGGLAAGFVAAPRVAQLYLQENRGPAIGARAAARKLAEKLQGRALELTALAHRRGLLRKFDGRVSARAVVGAVEALAYALLSGEDVGDPFAIPEAIVSLVLDGLRPAKLL